MKVNTKLLLLSALLIVAPCACSFRDKTMHTSTIFAMDTVMEIETLGHEECLLTAEEMIRNLERKISVTDENSEISRLNREGTAIVSEDVAEIFRGGLDICKRTEGALDLSIYPVLRAWGFTTLEYMVPTDEEIQALIENVDYRDISFSMEDGEVSIENGMQVDLGSVAKGYAGYAVANYLKSQGVESALINLGGNVQCLGSKPNGEKWKVAIKSPYLESSSGIYGAVAVADKAVITSGGYERYFEEDGKTYWHILDPETGRPAESGLVSVTIIGDDGLLCDGLSTALFVMGLEKAIDFYRASDDFEAVFITESGEAYVTEGIAGDFELSGEYYDTPINVISR